MVIGETGSVAASQTIMRRGILLVSVFYGCWSVIIMVGLATSVGGHVPPVIDMFGAWLSKLMPVVDGVILLKMLNRVAAKSDGRVGIFSAAGPSRTQRQSSKSGV